MVQTSPTPLEIVTLAQDLGLGAKSDPYKSIVEYCAEQVWKFNSEHDGFQTLSDLLDCVVNKANTVFREIRTNDDLIAVRDEYCNRRERAFANLENELSDDVYGITYRLNEPEDWENQYVSIIDCRGNKAFRSYFTKWHEIAHLLTLTDQGRLVFRRTHSSISGADPEEGLMDAIAGRIGFFDKIFHQNIREEISFSEIERLRRLLCPESSSHASIINFIKYWPTPCLHLTVGLGLNRDQEFSLNQRSFDFVEPPLPILRALKVSTNEKARSSGFQLFNNMRVPEDSVIYRAFLEEGSCDQESVEDLAMWKGQKEQAIKVMTRKTPSSFEVIVIPV